MCLREQLNLKSETKPATTPAFESTGVCPCLVYVRGSRGLEAQIWYDPLVDQHGNVMVKPEGLTIVGKPFRLPPRVGGRSDWTPAEADELVKSQIVA